MIAYAVLFISCTNNSTEDFTSEDIQINDPDADSDSDSDPDSDTTTDEVVTLTAFFNNDPNFSLLSEAIEQIGFSEALDNPSSFTFFAPDNTAFEAYLTSLGINDIKNIPTNLLNQIVKNHMLSGAQEIKDLSSGYINTSAKEFSTQGAINMYIAKDGMTTLINGTVMITEADIEATNGTIHKVNKVIALPSVATFLMADPQFSVFAEGIFNDDGITNDLINLDTDFTVFIPANETFGDITITENILKYHVSKGVVKRSNSFSDEILTTESGSNLEVTISGNDILLTDESGNTANIMIKDIQAWNGAIHTINKVLIPN